jgi:hypothetical protein
MMVNEKRYWRQLTYSHRRSDMTEAYEKDLEVVLKLLHGQSDDFVCRVVAACQKRLVIPNWFTKAHVEELTVTTLTDEEFDEFRRWSEDDWADELSEAVREYYANFKERHTRSNNDD